MGDNMTLNELIKVGDKAKRDECPEQVKITCHSEKCLVCNGHGTVNYGQITCKVCQGKCYILVPNEMPKDE